MNRLAFLALFVACHAAADVGTKQAASKRLTDAAKASVSALLKDPDSAKFQNVFVRLDASGNGKLCGQVNARNGYGGYTGYLTFIADVHGDAVDIRLMDSADQYEYAKAACYQAGL